jgi:hypothetical protein|tara:strand:+ start:71 stop:289 length:219 start_codon:yes stop_codon:yes gene_type:complete
MSHIKVEGSQHLYRDEESFAIINKDTSALQTAKRIKQRMVTQESEINTLREEVNEMKNILLQMNERLKWQEQ